MKQTLDFAPMESIGAATYRQLHARFFGGVDSYYIPFITPTVTPAFTDRQLREIAPEVNVGYRAVPQLLTRRSEDFIWAARELASLGYDEVNLNLGCPAGTVVAKGKGSGFLREPYALECFLDAIFSAQLPIAISVKTRIGWCAESEFDALLELYSHFPLKRLTIHPRLKTDQYKGYARKHVFAEALTRLNCPIGYNGDIVTVTDIESLSNTYPRIDQIMVGRALIADPALARKARGGAPCTTEELLAFSDALLEGYTQLWGNRKNALMRMKEYWFFFANLYEDNPRATKAIFKSRTEADYREAITQLTSRPILPGARFGWFKPLL